MNAHTMVSYAIGLATVGCALGAFYAIAGAWKSGRFRVASRKRLINVIETAALTQHAVLQIVRIGKRYYAIAGGGGNVRVLCEISAADLESETAA